MASAPRVVPEHRQNAKGGPRSPGGLFLPIPSLQRFAGKCRFDPVTGCVVWEGGKTSGRGDSKPIYGSFWDDGRRWFTHRWSAAKLHGFDITGLQVDHYCPHLVASGRKPNTLCVQHVRPETQEANLALQAERHRAMQASTTRQFWLFVSLGIEALADEPAPIASNDEMPFYDPPAWFAPFMPAPPPDCPF
jgi:hypothetical protein